MRSILRSGIKVCNDGDETIRKSCNTESISVQIRIDNEGVFTLM